MKSVMTHQFSQVPSANIPRSSFDRSHGYKTTFDAGYLVPFFADEVLPGDTFNLKTTAFARLSTPEFPFMDNAYLDTQYFAVPIRLIWDNFQKFHGEQDNPGDSTDFTIPQMVSTAVTGYANESIHDYLGIPTQVPDVTHSSLFHRAYNLIWNSWYRDENLQDSLVVDKDDGPDLPTDYVLQRRGKRHDYFTSSLPWPQKGDSVSIPLGTSAPVISDGTTVTLNSGAAGVSNSNLELQGSTQNVQIATTSGSGADQTMQFGDNSGLETDLTTATAATINQLRQAFQIQKLIERDARSGTRYTEVIRSHFGVVSPDARLQRPEFLGGGSSPLNATPVAATNEQTLTGNPINVGTLGAYATAGISGHGFTKSFTEHCIIIGMISCRADLTYQQGLNKMFSRLTRYDHYYPALSHIGEQTVLNKEIYAQGNAADESVFGYQERYAEYRYKPSQITGKFRSNDVASLDAWHLSQEFTSLPTLSPTFIEENAPFDRIVAVPTEPHFILDVYNKLQCARPMPLYGVPGMLDHF